MVEAILKVRDLRVDFGTRRGVVHAVAGVSFDLNRGETLGIVGESGSGKTVTCLALLRMLPAGAGRVSAGSIELNGRDLLKLSPREMARVRGREIGMIMQDPMTSLDPLFTVGEQVRETIPAEAAGTREQLRQRVKDLLGMVRIPAPGSRLKSYPHQLSGGMRQRVVAAISLSSEPAVLLADEPTTALDVTIQIQFLDLLKSIQREHNLAMILVTHDLSIVSRACDRVAVMYAGRIVETGDTLTLFEEPRHPYTKALLRSVPRLGEFPARLPTIEGQPPDLALLPPGCPFNVRCPAVMDICRSEVPPRKSVQPGHEVACWLESTAMAAAVPEQTMAATAAAEASVAP